MALSQWCPVLLLFGCFLASVCKGATRDEDELALVYGDRSMVSIATGSRQPLRRAPAVATVVTADDIAAMGAVDLDEVLETVPGLHVGRIPVLNAPIYSMRGIYSSGSNNPHVLLLYNGVPMTSLYSGDRGSTWRGMPLEDVERIEVIRGPGSALYGADAYAGVINVVTKTAADMPGTQAGVRLGSFDTRNAWLLHGGRWGEVELAAYLHAGRTDGHERTIAADAQSQLDGLFGTDASLAPGPANLHYRSVDASVDLSQGRWRLRAGYRLRADIGTGYGVASALDPAGHGRAERTSLEWLWNDDHFAQDWRVGSSLAFVHFAETARLVLFPAGATFPTGSFPDGVLGGPERSERQWRFAAHAVYSGWPEHRIRLGAGHDHLDFYRTRTYKNYLLNAGGLPVPTGPQEEYSAIQPHILPHRRRLVYAYLQDEWGFARDWTLTAGIRHDRYSDFGSSTNPRLAIVWDAAYNVSAKLLYGRAFRAPTLNESRGINPVANGNPRLRPETIETAEAVLSWQPAGTAHLQFSLFHYEMRDVIRTAPNPAPTPGSTYQNVGAQHGRGMEVELTWEPLQSVRVQAHYAHQRSIDRDTDADSAYAPRHDAYLRVDWRIAAGWRAGTQLNHISGRRRAAGDGRPRVPDYTTVDLTLRTAGSGNGWDVSASVRNLFDADVREPSQVPGALPHDLPQARRSLYLQAVHRL